MLPGKSEQKERENSIARKQSLEPKKGWTVESLIITWSELKSHKL